MSAGGQNKIDGPRHSSAVFVKGWRKNTESRSFLKEEAGAGGSHPSSAVVTAVAATHARQGNRLRGPNPSLGWYHLGFLGRRNFRRIEK